jgi:CHAT domain-containing protein
VADMIANSHGYINAESQLDLAVRGELNRGSWNYLPGTLDEINEIDSTIQTNYSVSKYIGDNANEESIKLLKFSVPAILHIATHGFYIRNLSELHKNTYISNFYSSSDKQAKLIRTGLLLAGANNVWTGRQEKIQGAEDGILTSAEISNLDLENVQLLVLSACESGRGYIDPIDGVYGLQRAFKQAGVKTIVMSLWKIPDAPTAILMEEFYKNIITGCSPNQALNIAKRELQHKGYTDPYYWASFVVLD